ncbi:VOC family protein [Xenorhabdus nematophila]|uniref:VOC family protein n=1 Tax=Xenorhabdus nematophila TaxID=628 RepID=UPI0005420EA9|nr:VOC family protein [Xenorhabdus nematophila]CEF30390.1 Protein yecM [Xenorhabdus nematophila str. Websteri]AYA40313.1 VOC family protein [Xenorhabdus nematophila]KHD28754.1 metal-binding protein [Xenorhabdus nematophila]MBA0018984.1 VOC family protein [Xenorhabdus nematophila]MCB4424397.1 VOC family protein [Xenorhabdus nematophila]
MIHFSTIPELQDLAVDLAMFEQKLKQFAEDLSLYFTQYSADHISLRCNEISLANQWRRGFLQCGQLMSENIINGRPICLFELEQPINLLGWKIDCVELPYPTQKHYIHQGWEHVEIVLPTQAEQLIYEAYQLLPDPLPDGFRIKESHPKGDKERLPNPTLAVTNGEITVKFHPFSIQKIVSSEV